MVVSRLRPGRERAKRQRGDPFSIAPRNLPITNLQPRRGAAQSLTHPLQPQLRQLLLRRVARRLVPARQFVVRIQCRRNFIRRNKQAVAAAALQRFEQLRARSD